MQDWARFEMERKSFLPAWLGRTQYGKIRGRTLLMQVAANGNTTRQR
jgi:hypothetical protein